MAGGDCPGCGARVKSLEARFCEYCGAALPRAARPVEPAPVARHGDVAARFRELDRHPDRLGLLDHTPSGRGEMVGFGCLVVFGLLFTLIPLAMIFGLFATGFPGSGLIAIFPFLFVGVGVALSLFGIVKAVRFANAPLEREPALVTGERTQVSGGGHNRSATTTYHVTLEFADGRRREYRTKGSVVGEVSEGDMGIAYLRSNLLLDFRRVRV